MINHNDIWHSIDRLAAKHGLTASGLARRAGLDPTTFNPSKRTTSGGRARWPSTESIAKILEATDTSMTQFVSLLNQDSESGGLVKAMPLINLSQAAKTGSFDEAGLPSGKSWDEIELPVIVDDPCYAIEITGNALEPVYREGDVIVIAPNANIKRSDRVIIKMAKGDILVRQLVRQTANKVEVRTFNPKHADRTFSREEILWIARIIWASQ
jgi:phage repressor protein C with HTH and peptisase S24 domain